MDGGDGDAAWRSLTCLQASVDSSRVCISYLKISDESSLKKLVHNLRVHYGGNLREAKPEAAVHNAFIIRKQRNGYWSSGHLLLFLQSSTLAYETMLSTIREGSFSPQLNHSHRNLQKCASMVMLNPGKLTMKTHHTLMGEYLWIYRSVNSSCLRR